MGVTRPDAGPERVRLTNQILKLGIQLRGAPVLSTLGMECRRSTSITISDVSRVITSGREGPASTWQ
jgi:hypothetical protein